MQGAAVVFFLTFAAVAWKNFRLSFFGLVILLPAYLIRVDVGVIERYRLPTTFLELAFGAIVLIWFVRYARADWQGIQDFFRTHRFFSLAFAVFFLASLISIFISDMWWYSFGQWRAYFLEPMLLFCILIGRRQEIRPKHIIEALAISTISISSYAIFQMITGWGIATPEWANAATRRATAFFSSPNAVGLYLGPIIPLMIAYIWVSKVRATMPETGTREKIWARYGAVGLLALSLAALFFSFSQGAWIAVAAGMIIFLFLFGWRYRTAAIALAILGIVAAAVVPPIRDAVLFRDQAGHNRLLLWRYSWDYLTESPTHFVFGAGIRQFFRKIQKPHYNAEALERLIYPHNIFLNFWTEAGLAGMISFAALIGYGLHESRKFFFSDMVLSAGLTAALVVTVVHGLVDVPYFKNDLAMLFWIIMALIIVSNSSTSRKIIEW